MRHPHLADNSVWHTGQVAYDTFVEAGGTIVTMSDEEKAAWLNALPNIPDTATELGPTGLKILERYVELLKENGVNIPRDWQFNY